MTMALVSFPICALADDDVATNSPTLLTDQLNPEPLTFDMGSWKLTPGLDTGVEQTDNMFSDDTHIPVTFFASGLRLSLEGDLEGTTISLNAKDKLLLPVGSDPTYRSVTSKFTFKIKHAVNDSTTLRLKSDFGTFQDGISPDTRKVENFYEFRPSADIEVGKYTLHVEGLAGKRWFPGYKDVDDNPAPSPKQRDTFGLTATLSKEIADNLEIYGGASARAIHYEIPFDYNDLRRGNSGYLLFAGLRGALTDKVEMDLSIAGVKENFLEKSFRETSYLSANGFILFKPQDDFTLRLETFTGMNESLDFGGAARFYRLVNFGTEYRLADKWFAVGNASYEWADYLYSGITERTATLSAGLTYQVTQFGFMSFNFEKTILQNDDPLFNYTENRFFAKMSIN